MNLISGFSPTKENGLSDKIGRTGCATGEFFLKTHPGRTGKVGKQVMYAQEHITTEPGLSGRIVCGIERVCDYESGFSSETS